MSSYLLWTLIALVSVAGLCLFRRDSLKVKRILKTIALTRDGGAVTGGLITYPTLELRVGPFQARVGAHLDGAGGAGGGTWTFGDLRIGTDLQQTFRFKLQHGGFAAWDWGRAGTSTDLARRVVSADVIEDLRSLSRMPHAEICLFTEKVDIRPAHPTGGKAPAIRRTETTTVSTLTIRFAQLSTCQADYEQIVSALEKLGRNCMTLLARELQTGNDMRSPSETGS